MKNNRSPRGQVRSRFVKNTFRLPAGLQRIITRDDDPEQAGYFSQLLTQSSEYLSDLSINPWKENTKKNQGSDTENPNFAESYWEKIQKDWKYATFKRDTALGMLWEFSSQTERSDKSYLKSAILASSTLLYGLTLGTSEIFYSPTAKIYQSLSNNFSTAVIGGVKDEEKHQNKLYKPNYKSSLSHGKDEAFIMVGDGVLEGFNQENEVYNLVTAAIVKAANYSGIKSAKDVALLLWSFRNAENKINNSFDSNSGNDSFEEKVKTFTQNKLSDDTINYEFFYTNLKIEFFKCGILNNKQSSKIQDVDHIYQEQEEKISNNGLNPELISEKFIKNFESIFRVKGDTVAANSKKENHILFSKTDLERSDRIIRQRTTNLKKNNENYYDLTREYFGANNKKPEAEKYDDITYPPVVEKKPPRPTAKSSGGRPLKAVNVKQAETNPRGDKDNATSGGNPSKTSSNDLNGLGL